MQGESRPQAARRFGGLADLRSASAALCAAGPAAGTCPSRRFSEPAYVGRAKEIARLEAERRAGHLPAELRTVLNRVGDGEALATHTQFGSCIFANKPGDGSAREQAASCQKVLGGFANICYEYATKRYRSNCINWGILPFTLGPDTAFDYEPGDCIFVPEVRQAVVQGKEEIPAKVIRQDGTDIE